MLGTRDLVAFVLTNDAARAKAFYEGTLGLKFVSQDDYAVVFNANGVMLRVTIVPGHAPTEHTVEQDELGIWSSPDGKAKVAWFKDPDGNVLSISQL